MKFRPVGFLDADPKKKGRLLYGIRIFNGLDEIEKLPSSKKPAGFILSPGSVEKTDEFLALREFCSVNTMWVKELNIYLKELPENTIPK